MARYSFGIPPTASLILASALWAVATVISKKLLASVSPITFLVIQLAPSVSVLWVLVLAKGMRPVKWRTLLPLTALGWLNPGLSYTLSMLGLTRTTASVATLLWAAEPALIVGMAWLVLREPLTGRLVALTATAACGVLLVSGVVVDAGSGAGDEYGTALILAGVLCCSLYTVLTRGATSVVDPLLTVALQLTMGLIWAVAIWPLELRGNPVGYVLALSPGELAGGAISGLMYYAAAFWFYVKALRSIRASVAGGFLNLTPLFAIATAYIFLGERLTQSQWIGAMAILLSVFALLTWSASPRARISTE
jgi:drug/metabolite transporter (DMT)-like permease